MLSQEIIPVSTVENLRQLNYSFQIYDVKDFQRRGVEMFTLKKRKGQMTHEDARGIKEEADISTAAPASRKSVIT